MAFLNSAQLPLERCPHCNVDSPSLLRQNQLETTDFQERNKRYWRIYVCQRCGGVITAGAEKWEYSVKEMYPSGLEVDEALPERARAYLEQAVRSLNAPAGSLMLAASAVDAMLKSKGRTTGSLFSRIDAAAEEHEITAEMAQWAHEVRLDSNEQRHADEEAPLPEIEDARRAIDFVIALGDLMFVLPSRVQRGIEEASRGEAKEGDSSEQPSN